MLFLLLVPVLAQDDVPEAAVEAALDAAEAALGERGGSFTYEFLGLTNDSTLNCTLVEGEELPFQATGVRVNIIYPNNVTYTVHASISGQVTVLCDTDFGEAMTTQFAEDVVCNVTPLAGLPAYVAPNTALDGVFTANAGEAYRAYGLASDGGWYQIAGEASLGWIESTSATIVGNCDALPVMAVSNPGATEVCFVTPQAGFTNVRARPTTDSERVDRIYENSQYQVTALNSQGTWFYIQPAGWVSNTVVFTLGDCLNILSNDHALGGGFAEADPGTIDTDTATILAQFECPSDFSGYLPARIPIGTASAQVELSSIPNTLRVFPSVDDTIAPRLGLIQPGRTINRVIAGPACNQGFVWWLVEVDTIVGWTAESNASSNDYYLVPAGDIAATTSVSSDALQVGDHAVSAVAFSSDGSRIFTAGVQQGFGDAKSGFVIIWDAQGQQLARIEEPAGIVAMDYAENANLLAVAAGNGTVTFYNPASFEAIVSLANLFDRGLAPQVVVSPDADFVAVLSCATADCTSSIVKTFTVVDGSQIAFVNISNLAMNALAINRDGTGIALGGASAVWFYSAPDLTLGVQSASGVTEISSISFNADGTQALVTGCSEHEANTPCSQGLISLLETNSPAIIGVVSSHAGLADKIVLNPAGTRFVTTSDVAPEVIERSSTTGQETNRFTLDVTQITSMVYTADGHRLAVGTADGRVVFFGLEE
jgi:hypothetical protein